MYDWTFMVYMAGDNGKVFADGRRLMANLVGYGWDNIREMSRAGSTSQVAITAQYDTLDANETPRLFIDGKSTTGQVIETIPPINTGDPKNLTDFVVWAESNFPARQYALVLWNHGTGWKEDDIYRRYRSAETRTRRDQTRAMQSRERLMRRAFFMSSAAKIMEIEDDEVRAICYDDSSLDFLDNRDLSCALADAERLTGNRLAILGMDACLMSMIEVAYQIRGYADYMVSSQEVEEAAGWPYDRILHHLIARPEMAAEDLSKMIVAEFADRYTGTERGGGGKNTQSAIDLRALDITVNKLKPLSDLIVTTLSADFQLEIALGRAGRDAQSFDDKDYLDLRHLMEVLHAEYSGTSIAGQLARELREHLTLGVTDGPIKANFHGPKRPQANGLSIYFPARTRSAFYGRQDFVSSGWDQVVWRTGRRDDE